MSSTTPSRTRSSPCGERRVPIAGGGDVAAFIWGIGIRRLIDAIRRENGHGRRLPWRAAEPAAVVSAEDQVLVGMEHGRLGQALAALSPELRGALEATVLDGLTCAEAAVLLGVAEGTVMSRRHRARLALRAARADIRVDGLSRRYGATRALYEVDLTPERGSPACSARERRGQDHAVVDPGHRQRTGRGTGVGVRPGPPGWGRAGGDPPAARLPPPGTRVSPALHGRRVPGLRGDPEGDHRPAPPCRGGGPGAGRRRPGRSRPHPDTGLVRRDAAAPSPASR
jgi:hypothetical protein